MHFQYDHLSTMPRDRKSRRSESSPVIARTAMRLAGNCHLPMATTLLGGVQRLSSGKRRPDKRDNEPSSISTRTVAVQPRLLLAAACSHVTAGLPRLLGLDVGLLDHD
jgi:hypothetical protein